MYDSIVMIVFRRGKSIGDFVGEFRSDETNFRSRNRRNIRSANKNDVRRTSHSRTRSAETSSLLIDKRVSRLPCARTRMCTKMTRDRFFIRVSMAENLKTYNNNYY